MKRVVLGLVAVAALMLVPSAAKADHDHHHHRHHSRYGHSHRDHHRGYYGHQNYYRPPVTVYRNSYPSCDYGYGHGGYGGPNTSFYYSGRNASFGFGF